jgi:hypothetical protein
MAPAKGTHLQPWSLEAAADRVEATKVAAESRSMPREECAPDPKAIGSGWSARTATYPSRGLQKRWLYLLPIVFVTYSVAYLDRANYGFGAAAGLAATLHITDTRADFWDPFSFSAILPFRYQARRLRGNGVLPVWFLPLLLPGDRSPR